MMTDKNDKEAAERRNEVLSIIRSVCKQLHGETGVLEDVVFGCERTLRWNEKASKAFMNENREIYIERYNKGKSDLEYYLKQYVKYCKKQHNNKGEK